MYKRYFKAEDYEMLAGWWDSWDWQPVPLQFLPPTGLIIGDDQGDICAVFIYKTDTPIVWAENYISNINAKGKRRKDAMDFMMSELKSEVKSMGYSVIMSAVKHDNLALKLEKAGFLKSDTDLTNYIGVL